MHNGDSDPLGSVTTQLSDSTLFLHACRFTRLWRGHPLRCDITPCCCSHRTPISIRWYPEKRGNEAAVNVSWYLSDGHLLYTVCGCGSEGSGPSTNQKVLPVRFVAQVCISKCPWARCSAPDASIGVWEWVRKHLKEKNKALYVFDWMNVACGKRSFKCLEYKNSV